MPGFVALEKLNPKLLEPHLAGAARVLKNYTTIFIFEDGHFGSGTFVRIGAFNGILTAYHVAEHVFKFPLFHFCMDVVEQEIEANPETMQHVPIGIPGQDLPANTGPDLSLLIIRNPTLAQAIAQTCGKTFYDLDSVEVGCLNAPTYPKAWAFTGTYEDSYKRIIEDYKNGLPLSKLTNFVGSGFLNCEITRDKAGFDYVRLLVPAGEFKFPHNYMGLSGGGFWHVPFEISGTDINTIGFRSPVLAGVQFSQSDPNLGTRERILFGHGPASVYKVARKTLESKTSSLLPLSQSM